MTDSWIWWAPFCAAVLHITEEFFWPGGFPEWDRMYRPHIAKSITKSLHIWINALLLFGTLSLALSARSEMAVAGWLTFASLLFGNAIFHVFGTIRTKRYSPGLVTGLALYVPMAIFGYEHFLTTRQATKGTAIVAILLGMSYQLWGTMMHKARAGRVLMALAVVLACACSKAPSGPVEVAFEFPRSQILLPVKIEGRETVCLLDTGTNPSGIDSKLAEELKLEIKGPGEKAEGVGNENVLIRATSFTVAVGGAAPAKIDAVTSDFSRLSARLGRPLGCILGQSWLTSRVVQIDYPKKVVRVGAPARPGCETWPMKYWVADDAMPLVEVRVLDAVYPVTLDTGSSETLRLFLKDNPPAGVEVVGSKTATGFRGDVTVVSAKVALLSLGPISMQDVKISLAERNEGEPHAARMGNVGNGVLQNAVLTLDYPGKKISVCAAGGS